MLKLAPNRPIVRQPTETSESSKPMSNFSRTLHESKLAFFAKEHLPSENADRVKLAEEYRREFNKLKALEEILKGQQRLTQAEESRYNSIERELEKLRAAEKLLSKRL